MANAATKRAVERLSVRGSDRTEADIQSDIQTVLAGGDLNLSVGDVPALEQQTADGTRRRIDIAICHCVIEVKKDLRNPVTSRGQIDHGHDVLDEVQAVLRGPPRQVQGRLVVEARLLAADRHQFRQFLGVGSAVNHDHSCSLPDSGRQTKASQRSAWAGGPHVLMTPVVTSVLHAITTVSSCTQQPLRLTGCGPSLWWARCRLRRFGR